MFALSSLDLTICTVLLFQGVRSSTINTCEHHDPCQHGGVCISTDNGPACDCKGIDYTGVYCEKGTFNMTNSIKMLPIGANLIQFL